MTDTCGFYWVLDGKLAGSGYPGACLNWIFQEQGIRAILSLQPLAPKDFEQAQDMGILVQTEPILDFTAGFPAQRNRALHIINDFQSQGLPTLVHCQGGLGRTGMILALYLVREKGFSADSAIKKIRTLRQGSIEPGTGQEEAIRAAKETK
ncbi:MAG: dual specificity protein phosphatase family protein [Promethearchaeota archaeon]